MGNADMKLTTLAYGRELRSAHPTMFCGELGASSAGSLLEPWLALALLAQDVTHHLQEISWQARSHLAHNIGCGTGAETRRTLWPGVL
jgi:hypothetical protein